MTSDDVLHTCPDAARDMALSRALFGCAALCGILACTEAQHLAAPPVALVEEIRLDPHIEDFSSLGRVFVGPRREIAVPQPQDRQVRLYDSAGARIAILGRPGSGPGEFQWVGWVGWAADTLWVLDPQQGRLTYFAPDGAMLRTSAIPSALIRGAPLEGDTRKVRLFLPLVVYPDGSMFGEARLGGGEVRDSWPERVLLFATPEGRAMIVARPPAYEDERWFMTVSGFGRPVPFAASPHVAFTPDGGRFAWLTTQISRREGGELTLTMFE